MSPSREFLDALADFIEVRAEYQAFRDNNYGDPDWRGYHHEAMERAEERLIAAFDRFLTERTAVA